MLTILGLVGDIGSNNSSMTNLTGLLAPPMYERHIYDRLWSDISPVATPLASGPATQEVESF